MEKEQKRFTDIAIQINLALWTSLIAINGITIAGFAIIATSYNFNLLISLIVITPSIISCFFIINNFLVSKQQYEIIMNILDTITQQEITENQKEKNKDDAKKKHKIIESNTIIVIKLMFIQILFFILLIYFEIFFPDFFNFIFMKNTIPPTVSLFPWQTKFHCPY